MGRGGAPGPDPYAAPPPPLFQKIFAPTYMTQYDQRDEAVILSHICWARESPPPPPPSSWPPDPPPPSLKVAGKREGAGVWPVATPPHEDGPMWVSKCWCGCDSMCSCVLGCTLGCCFVV